MSLEFYIDLCGFLLRIDFFFSSASTCETLTLNSIDGWFLRLFYYSYYYKFFISNDILLKMKTTSWSKNIKKSEEFKEHKKVWRITKSKLWCKHSHSLKCTMEMLVVKLHTWESNMALSSNVCNWVVEHFASSKVCQFFSLYKVHINHEGNRFQIWRMFPKSIPPSKWKIFDCPW